MINDEGEVEYVVENPEEDLVENSDPSVGEGEPEKNWSVKHPLTPGHKTTEFWVSIIAAVIIPVFGLFVLNGVISAEEAELYEHLVLALVPLALAIVAGSYTQSRHKLKIEHVKRMKEL